MTRRRGPYLRLQIGGVTVTVRDRPAWARLVKRLAAAVPVGALLASAWGGLRCPPWW